jgi:hypothetical protein
MKVKVSYWLIVEKIIRIEESPIPIKMKRTGSTNLTVI